MKYATWLLLLGLLLLCSVPASARITNAQDKMFSIQKDGLYLHSDLLINWTTGTAEVLQFGGALGSEWLKEPHLLFLNASGTFAQKDDERFINQYYGHLRYRFRIWRMIMAEMFIQGEYNEFRRLFVRMPLGAGPRLQYEIGENCRVQVAFGTSYMFELVHLSEDSDADGVRYADSLAYEHNHRWNNYLAFKVNLPILSLGATAYIQPKFNDFGDWMLLVESNLSFKVTDRLSVAFTYTLFQDSAPPQGVIKRDTALNAQITLAIGPLLPRTETASSSTDAPRPRQSP